MTKTPTGFRRLTEDEILELASRIRYQDRVDLTSIREGITQLFPGAYKATLIWEGVYNDETTDLRPTDITVWDAKGNEIKRDIPEDDWDEELDDFAREVEIGEAGENDSMGEMTLFMADTKGLDLPALYIREETT